jgi:S-adenosylmethionine/arginine decarboxylase-like enzyme
LETIFGWELVLDLKDCNDKIKDKNKLKVFINKLCQNIDMITYGEPLIEHFGHNNDVTSGYSIAQLIETSLISGHFSEKYRTAHINIFSCKPFNFNDAGNFCRDFFEGTLINEEIIERRLV